MSALPEPLPVVEPALKPLTPVPPPSRRNAALGLLLFLIVTCAGGFWIWRSLQRNHLEEQRLAAIRSARRVPVHRGTLEVRVKVSGTMRARVFANIVAPRLRTPENDRAMPLIRVAPAGARVRKGDLVAQFDPQATKDHLDDTRDGLHNRSNALAKAKVQLDVEFFALLKSIDQARGKVDKARWDLKSISVRSKNAAEGLQLNLEQAQAEYEELLAQLPLRLESQAASQAMSEISEEIERLHVERHEEDLARLDVHTPVDGMVVLQSYYRHGGEQVTIDAGDRLTPGQPFMRVVDTRTLQLEGAINQAECEQFRIGQQARIQLDAYPEALYHGRVHSIGVMAVTPGRQQYYLRTVPIRVEVMDADEKLFPDLTASAEVVIDRVENVLLAPSDAVKEENGQSFVYVQKGDGVEKRVVTKGRMSGTHTVLEGGVNEGEVVVIE